MATIERAVALGHSPEWSQILGRPDWIHAMLLEWAGELSVARRHFEALYRAAVDRGDEHSLPFILYHFARIELLTGDWQQARNHARESRRDDAAERAGNALLLLARGRGARRRPPRPCGGGAGEDRGGARGGGRGGQPVGRLRAARDSRLPRALARKRERCRSGAQPSGGRRSRRLASASRRCSAFTATRSRRRSLSASWTASKRCSTGSTGSRLEPLGARHGLPRPSASERLPAATSARPEAELERALELHDAARGAVRARPHALRPRQRPPARSEEARRPRSTRERTRGLRPARRGPVGGEGARGAGANRRPRTRDRPD